MKGGGLYLSLGVSAVLAGLHVTLAPVAWAQGGPSITPPIQSHTTVENHVTVQIPDMDPVVVREASGEAAGGVLNTIIAPPPIQWANELLGIENVWTATPDNLTWNNDAIKKLAALIQGVGIALIVLAIIARAFGVMLRGETWEGMGRLMFAALASFGNLVWWQWGIQLNNAINASISAPSLPSLIRPHLTTQIDPASAVGDVVILVIYAVTAVLLMFSLLFRLGLIDILIACGGVLLICYATTQTEYIANHYTRLSVAVIFAQVGVCICLQCASVLATLGSGGVLGTLISVAILWLARSAPQQILTGASSSQGNRIGSLVTRMVMRRVGR